LKLKTYRNAQCWLSLFIPAGNTLKNNGKVIGAELATYSRKRQSQFCDETLEIK
jgi:hypothetical protein